MTQDIILDTTVEFIRANETNLQLAFQVEKALPEVRTELIKEFFKCVEKQLKENLDTKKGWEIRVKGVEVLSIRKPSWTQLIVGEVSSEDWWGVGLYPYEGEYVGYLVISVYNIKKISKNVRNQIEIKFSNSINQPRVSNEKEIWNYLENDREDVGSLDFLKKIIDEKKREEIVKSIAEKLAELAMGVDGVLSNSG